VPDAVTFGSTKREALQHARDALLAVFDAYMKDRRDIPEPSDRRGLGVEVPRFEASKIALYCAGQ
jgi:predicted RNase H-like HicB family nuclease